MKKKRWIQKVLTLLLIATMVLHPLPISTMQFASVVSAAEEDDDREAEKKEEEKKRKEEEERKKKEEEERKKKEEEEKKRKEEEERKRKEEEKKRKEEEERKRKEEEERKKKEEEERKKKEEERKKKEEEEKKKKEEEELKKKEAEEKNKKEEEELKKKEAEEKNKKEELKKKAAEEQKKKDEAERKKKEEEKKRKEEEERKRIEEEERKKKEEEEKTFTLVFKAKGGGKVALSSDLDEEKEKIRETVKKGSEIKVKALPKEGYKFREWTKDDEDFSKKAEIKVKAENAEYIAWFEKVPEKKDDSKAVTVSGSKNDAETAGSEDKSADGKSGKSEEDEDEDSEEEDKKEADKSEEDKDKEDKDKEDKDKDSRKEDKEEADKSEEDKDKEDKDKEDKDKDSEKEDKEEADKSEEDKDKEDKDKEDKDKEDKNQDSEKEDKEEADKSEEDKSEADKSEEDKSEDKKDEDKQDGEKSDSASVDVSEGGSKEKDDSQDGSSDDSAEGGSSADAAADGAAEKTGKNGNNTEAGSGTSDSGEEAGIVPGTEVPAGEEALIGATSETADDSRLVFHDKNVTVIADRDAFDGEVRMKVKKVTDPEQLLRMVTACQDEGGSYTVKAYNVTFYDKNGKEVEPNKPVQVIMNTKVSKPGKSKVVHVKDNHKTEILDADINTSGASFELDNFSDIGVATEGKAKIPGSRFDVYLGDELSAEYSVGDLSAGRISAEDLPEVEGYTFENVTVGDDVVEEIGTITDEDGHVYVYYTTKSGDGEIEAKILGDGRIHINLVETEQDTTYDLDANGMHVHVEAPAGAFDAGTYMEIEFVELTEEQQAQVREEAAEKLELTEDAQLRTQAVDITFYDKDGQKVQPRYPVRVELTTPQAVEGKFCVVHLGDEKGADRVDAQRNDDGKICFAAARFSVYVVVDNAISVDESRMTLYFINNTDPENPVTIATVYVKNGDVTNEEGDDTDDELKQIIFDPGAGTLASGELFKGWRLDEENYTVEDADNNKMTIEDIREWAKDLAKSNSIVDGEEHYFYAMIYKTFSVAYKDESGATVHSEALIFKAADGAVDYVINQPYTPKEQDEAFQGWYWTNSDSSVTDPLVAKNGSVAPFPNETEVTIKDNITFTVNVPRGYWLSFVENGKGVSYTPPQFIQEGEVTVRPENPTRAGYTFGGWYSNPECTGDQFVFGNPLTERTKLYAKWTTVPQADYHVVIWKQNLEGNGYDFAESMTLTGATESIINSVSSRGNGNERYARINGVDKQYTGFYLNSYDQNVTITPEGTAVVNVYYDRINYSVKFYYARIRNRNDSSDTWYVAYQITQNEELDLTGRTTWGNTNVQRSEMNSYGPGTQYEVHGNYRYYYFTIDALYGQDISNQWPRYSDFPDIGDYELISWWMMHSAGAWGGAGGGQDTVKGIISIMDEQILGNPRSSDGNFLIARYSTTSSTRYNYKIWKELPDGFDVPTDDNGQPKPTTTRQGKRYYLDETLIAKSNAGPNGIHQPVYLGFTNDGFTYTRVGNAYDVEMYYSRNKFKIVYMDGLYYNGDGVILNDLTGSELNSTADIYYESDIHSYNKGGVNYYEPTKTGYVFDGWYIDKACQTEAVFNEIPVHNVTVYAKWIQKEYRVFLHPNVPKEDTSFDLGGQNTSFRVDYGDKVADGNTIQGTRDEYDLIGWYTNEACTKAFNFDAFTLNDQTVTSEYSQTEDTELDKYGETISGQSGNKDAVNNRFWITRKLDLYAKWRARLEGANGINVIYDAGDGTNAPTDPLIHLDNSGATAGAASTPNDTKKQFLYWVVQEWNGTEYVDTDVTVYPGDVFTVLKANSKVIVTEWVNPDVADDVVIITDPQPGIKPPDETHTKIKTAIYTTQLRAEYEPKDAPTPTHIWWFPNDKEIGARHNAIAHDDDLQINQAVSIENPPERDGYQFLGWARVESTQSLSQAGTPDPTGKVLDLEENKLFLKYEDGEYKGQVNGEWKKVTKVAADEKDPYHDMYAVWKKVGVNITVTKRVTGNMADVNKTFTFTAKLPDNAKFEKQPSENGVNLSDDRRIATFSLKKDESVTISGVPSGYTLTITETNADSYDTSASGLSGTLDGKTYTLTVPNQNGEVTFTNTKTAIVDTGIDLDFLPYVLLLGAVAAAGAALFFRRRKEV